MGAEAKALVLRERNRTLDRRLLKSSNGRIHYGNAGGYTWCGRKLRKFAIVPDQPMGYEAKLCKQCDRESARLVPARTRFGIEQSWGPADLWRFGDQECDKPTMMRQPDGSYRMLIRHTATGKCVFGNVSDLAGYHRVRLRLYRELKDQFVDV